MISLALVSIRHESHTSLGEELVKRSVEALRRSNTWRLTSLGDPVRMLVDGIADHAMIEMCLSVSAREHGHRTSFYRRPCKPRL